MIKKVIDIISLEEVKNKKAERLKPKSRVLDSGVSLSFSSRKKPVFILTTIVLLGIFIYAYFALPKAEIKIWPKTEFLTVETEVIVGEKIPGEVLEITETIAQFFPVQGRFLKETKASGVIRVYNNHSTSPVHLVARTRFRSACGKEFRTPVAITIPGKRREGGVWVSGKLEVDVVAFQPGDEFNIEPTAFSVPGLRGTALFPTITGRSYKLMTGGEIREVSKVIQEDLDLAEDILTKKATEGCLNIFIKNNQGISILEEAVEVNVLESFADVEVGAEVEEFTFQVKAKCRTIIFRTDDMKRFTLDFLDNQIPENKLIVPESLKIDYSLENIDINKGEMALSLSLAAETYLAIDKVAIEKKLVGRSLSSVRDALEGWSGINMVDVHFWPFWVNRVPENLERVKIELKFD